MFNLLILISALLTAGLTLAAVVLVNQNQMAPRVRAALNDAYANVEFVKLNHLPERCDSKSLYRLGIAFAKYSEAEKCLFGNHYQRCIELAEESSAIIIGLRPKLVYRDNLKRVPPPMRIVSKPDGVAWMG